MTGRGSSRLTRSRAIAFAACAVGLAGAAGAASATGGGSEHSYGDRLPDDVGFAPGVKLDKDSAAVQAGLSPRLAELARDRVAAKPEQEQADLLSLPGRGPGSLLRDGDRLLVNIRVASTAGEVLDAIRAAGAEIVSVNGRFGTVDAAVLADDLRALAAASGVEYVGEDLEPLSAAVGPTLRRSAGAASKRRRSCQGAATAEGDLQSNSAGARRRYGMDGYGQKVGIISDSYDVGQGSITGARQDVRSGDLPGRKNPCGYDSKVQVLAEGAPTDIDEGRGMAQIVHDMAPGARIAFASRGASEDDMAGAVRALANAGSDVIVDDITFFDEPFFQEGPIANAATEVTNRGIPYYSSAANSNVIVAGLPVGSYEAPSFRPGGTCLSGLGLFGQCMDFNPGPGSDDVRYGLAVAPGSSFNVIMQWAEPRNGVATDLDLLAYDEFGGVISAVSGNNNIQSQKPVEVMKLENPYPFTAVFDIIVYRASGAATPRLKFIFGRAQLADVEYRVGLGGDVVGPTIMGHNGSLNSISTAAIDWQSSTEPEAFSSHGPTVNYFGPVNGTTPAAPLAAPQVLRKPDITATDNVQTTFFVPSQNDVPRFSGTSAAAPAAAAIAALQRQANPSLSPAQVLAAEQQTAGAIGGFGPLVVGAGLINGQAAVGVNPPRRPKTKITRKPGRTIRRSKAKFKFKSNIPARFQCRLGKRGRFRSCSSPVRVVGIRRGARVLFQVRAANGKAKDKSPAKYRFRRAR